MRILFFTPGAVGFKSPSVKMAEALGRERGHKVSIVAGDINRVISEGNYDAVFADFEMSVLQGYLSALTLDIPIYAHVEWIPKHRIMQTDEWGNGCILTPEEIEMWKNIYKPIAAVAAKCDVCSYADDWFVEIAEEFLGRKYGNVFIRPPELPPEAPETPIHIDDAEHAICIVARLAPIKRTPMLVEAVGRMEYEPKPKVYIVGDGEERMFALATAKKHNLDIELAGATAGEEKWDFIAKSRVMLAAWSGIPPGEALMMGRPTIMYDTLMARNLFGDAAIYTPNNDINAMARELDKLFRADSSEIESFVLQGRDKLINNELGLRTFDRQLDVIEETLESLVK